MTYGDYLTTSEMTRWILDTDILWDDIDPALALSQPDLLDRVRASALIESFFPIFTPRALDLLWDNVTATAIFSIQLYESYKHFHVFAQYLEAVGYRPIADEEVDRDPAAQPRPALRQSRAAAHALHDERTLRGA